MDITSHRLCPACGGSEVKGIYRARFVLPEGHPLSQGYEVVSCNGCGMVFADTHVDQAVYDRYYAALSKYEDPSLSSGGGLTPWDAARLDVMAACVARHLPGKDARIVDVGCANGGFINALRNLGYTRACGIDPSPSCVRFIRESLHAEAWVGFVDQVPEGAGPFDGVVFSHVLEHLPHPSAALSMARQHLAPGGLVYVEVPDGARYKNFLTAPFQEFNTEHINHFSQTTLRTLLEREGFAVVECGQKELESAPGMPYPAIYGICREAMGLIYEVSKDEAVEGLMAAYIQASTRIMRAMDQAIREALDASPRLIVWGTGQLAMKLMAETALSHADIVSFIDGNPVNQSRRIRGISVIHPEALDDRTTPILISSTIHEEEIGLAIRKRWGLPNPLIRLGNCLKA